MTSGTPIGIAVSLGLLFGAAACGREERVAEAVPAPTVPTPVRLALELDGAPHGTLSVTERPTPLARLLPPVVKPLAEWKRIHVLAGDDRFVLVSDPAVNNPGQIPALYLDHKGRAVFAMLQVPSNGELPASAAAMKKQSLAVHLPGVKKVGLWIDTLPPQPELPGGQLVLRHGAQQVPFGSDEIAAVVGAPLAFGGDGKLEPASGPEQAPGGPPGSGDKRKVGKPVGSPMGWPLAELLRKTVARGAEPIAIRLQPRQGEPVTLEPKWWTDENRFLGIRFNRKGEFVVHGYVLAERATAEVEVRDVQLVEAVTADVGGPRGGGPPGARPGRRGPAEPLSEGPRRDRDTSDERRSEP